MIRYWLLPAVCLGSLLLTWIIIRLARDNHWFDIPNHRSLHQQPVPTGGGLAFFAVVLIAGGVLFVSDVVTARTFIVLLLSAAPALLGLVDDFRGLGIRSRIAVQFATVLGALALLGGAPPIPLLEMTVELGIAGYVLAALVFVWFINLFNFMDGIDGIASLETLCVCLGAWIIASPAGVEGGGELLLVLSAAVAGFLLLNLPPAKIFMGDVGSNFLGYLIGAIGLITIREGVLNVWVWSILLGVFVVDATTTLFSRMREGDTWYHAHRSHAYQVAAQHWGSHARVDGVVLLINCCWLFPLAWGAQARPGWGLPLTLTAYLPLWLLVRYVRSGKFAGLSPLTRT